MKKLTISFFSLCLMIFVCVFSFVGCGAEKKYYTTIANEILNEIEGKIVCSVEYSPKMQAIISNEDNTEFNQLDSVYEKVLNLCFKDFNIDLEFLREAPREDLIAKSKSIAKVNELNKKYKAYNSQLENFNNAKAEFDNFTGEINVSGTNTRAYLNKFKAEYYNLILKAFDFYKTYVDMYISFSPRLTTESINIDLNINTFKAEYLNLQTLVFEQVLSLYFTENVGVYNQNNYNDALLNSLMKFEAFNSAEKLDKSKITDLKSKNYDSYLNNINSYMLECDFAKGFLNDYEYSASKTFGENLSASENAEKVKYERYHNFSNYTSNIVDYLIVDCFA